MSNFPAVETSDSKEDLLTYAVMKHIGSSWLVHRHPCCHPRYLHMQVQRCDLGQCDALLALAAAMRNAGHKEHGIARDVRRLCVTYKMDVAAYLSCSRMRPSEIDFKVGISTDLHQ